MSDTQATAHPEPAQAPAVQFQDPQDYRAQRPHIFPTQESFRWFLRNNRDELVQAGALLIPTGRWLVQPDLFDRCLIVIGTRKAAGKKSV